jgi:hypothetical protein
MKHFHGIGGISVILFLVSTFMGCASVTIRQPLPAKSDAAEQAMLEGEWVSEGQIIYVRFGENGIGRFAGVDWKEGRFQLDEGELIVTKGEGKSFLSVRVKESGVWDERYYFAQYRFTEPGGNLVLWLPDTKAFGDAVAKGKLEGVVEKGKHTQSVTISSKPEKVLEFLNDPANGALFDEKEPMILKKLVRSPATSEKEGASIEEGAAAGTEVEEDGGHAPVLKELLKE